MPFRECLLPDTQARPKINLLATKVTFDASARFHAGCFRAEHCIEYQDSLTTRPEKEGVETRDRMRERKKNSKSKKNAGELLRESPDRTEEGYEEDDEEEVKEDGEEDDEIDWEDECGYDDENGDETAIGGEWEEELAEDFDDDNEWRED